MNTARQSSEVEPLLTVRKRQGHFVQSVDRIAITKSKKQRDVAAPVCLKTNLLLRCHCIFLFLLLSTKNKSNYEISTT